MNATAESVQNMFLGLIESAMNTAVTVRVATSELSKIGERISDLEMLYVHGVDEGDRCSGSASF